MSKYNTDAAQAREGGISRTRLKEEGLGRSRVKEGWPRPNRSHGKELRLSKDLSRSCFLSRIRLIAIGAKESCEGKIRANNMVISRPRLKKKQEENPMVEGLSRLRPKGSVFRSSTT